MVGSNNGDVIYEVRADHSKIEGDIEQANAKVDKAVKKSADETVKTEKKKTQKIKQESDKVVKNTEKAADNVVDAWKDSSKKIEKSIGDIDGEDINIDVDVNITDAKNQIEDLVDVAENAGEKINDSLGGDDKATAAGNIGEILKSSFNDAVTSSVPLIGKVGELTKGLSGTQTVALGMGAAVVGVGVLAVGAADDMSVAMNNFLAATGKSKEETKRYQGILEDIYANNYGDSFQDIADAMVQVRQQIGPVVDYWDDAALQEFTESAFALRDAFGYEITESVRAANTMMEQFGVDGLYAFDLIATGAQNGLDYSGELLDSINEYSVQFEKLGMDADDMFKIFQAGADSGAFNLDKIGDAVKEMSIRVIDGSDTTKEGFELIGLNAEEMAAKFSAGGESAKEAFNQTLDALAALEDPMAQNTAGVDLFGTMWEDLGADAVTALAEIEEGSYDTADAMEQIKEVKYDDLGSMFEALKRNVELLLIPLGEALIPLLTILIDAVLPVIQELLGPLIDLFTQLIMPIISLVETAITPLIDIFLLLIDVAIKPLIDIIEHFLVPIFTGGLEGMASDTKKNIENIKNIFKNILDFIKNVFTGNWKAAWENVKNIFSAIASTLSTIWKSPINFIIDGINKFIGGLNGIKIPDWVPVVGGKGFSISKIPRLKVGMEYVPSDYFPAFLDEGEAVLTKEENAIFRSLGGLEGMTSFLKNNYQDLLKRREMERVVVIHTHVDLDGEEVGNSITRYVDDNFSESEDLGKRGN